MLKNGIRMLAVAVAATAVLTTAGATGASAATPAHAARPVAAHAAVARPAAVAPAGAWRLYSILSSPQACWYVGALGVWNGLWYDFLCIGVNLTSIGPGVDYLWVK